MWQIFVIEIQWNSLKFEQFSKNECVDAHANY